MLWPVHFSCCHVCPQRPTKCPKRMFALKVQTNILFDYFQTDLHGRHQDVGLCLDSQNKHQQPDLKYTSLTNTWSSCTQHSCHSFSHKKQLIFFQYWRFCILITQSGFKGLCSHTDLQITGVWDRPFGNLSCLPFTMLTHDGKAKSC